MLDQEERIQLEFQYCTENNSQLLQSGRNISCMFAMALPEIQTPLGPES